MIQVENTMKTIGKFQDLNDSDKLSYVLALLDLDDNYLIGTVQPQRGNVNFIIVKNLINPYTGEKVNRKLLQEAKVTNSAICLNARNVEGNLVNNQILFRFTVNQDKTNSLMKGEILSISENSIIPIDYANDVLRELNISLEYIIENTNQKNEFKSVYLTRDFYQSMILEKISTQIDEITEKKYLLDNEMAALDVERNNLLELKHEISLIKLEMKKLGFTFSDDSKINNENEKSYLPFPDNENDLLYQIQQQIANLGLNYDIKTIRQFYTSLKTNQLVILSGPSGTGKTSLISAFAQVTDSYANIIPVQPSWTDKQDLLGVYNPLQQRYVPTAFLDALIEAGKNQDKLYIICLDEMNLAQIEYYLADILSIKEQKEPELILYSDYEYEQNLKEIIWYVQKSYPHLKKDNIGDLNTVIEDILNIKDIDQYNYVKRYNNISRYKSRIKIPENVRLVGTVNIDGTVRPISTKVLDRSFIIPINKQRPDLSTSETKGYFDLKIEDLNYRDKLQKFADLRLILEKLFSEDLSNLKASYNDRVEKHIDEYIALSSSFDVNKRELLDDIVTMKILPRINYLLEYDMNPNQRFIKNIEGVLGKESYSFKKALEMNKQSNETRIYSYWS